MRNKIDDRRVDAAEKLSARVPYIRDMQIPDMWFGTTIRSPHPRARIISLTFEDDFDWQQVAKITAADIPVNYVSMLENDMPFLAAKQVNYCGEPVAILAAPSKKLLAEAVRHVKVDYKPLPPLFDMLEAQGSTVKIFGENNVFKEIHIVQGDLNKAGQSAYQEIEIVTYTGYQEHLYLEPQGIIAIPGKKSIEIHGSLQCPYYIKNALVTMFDNRRHITVIQSATGGAFGGKEDYPSLLAGHAALLADACGHPVAMFYDREEDVAVTTKRHPAHQRSLAYVNKDGIITGIDLDIHLDGGAYCTLSPVVLARTALTALGSYYVPNVKIHAVAVATSTVPSGAFRGFGGPQAVFAIEMLIEKIAAVLDLPPDEVRRRNLIREGQQTATGQILKYSVSAQETFDDVLERSNYRQKYKTCQEENQPLLKKMRKGYYAALSSGKKLHGIGISAFQHGAGFTGTGENKIKGKIALGINPDGTVTIFCASTEMGQGEQTVMGTILSRALQLTPDMIHLSAVNTDLVPDSGPTVASRTTMIVGSLLIDAAKDLIDYLSEQLEQQFGETFSYQDGFFSAGNQKLTWREVAEKNTGYRIEKEYKHPPFIKFDDINWRGDAYPVFSWAAAVAEIEVDPVTFDIRVTHYTTTHDIGKAINHDQAVAQVQGGSLQGIGFALYEKAGLENGKFDITGFSDYIIPTAVDAPEFTVHIMENPYPYGPFGAKGLGEMPLVGAAPAVVSAFLWMIFGEEFNTIPVLPETLSALFHKTESETSS